MSIATALQALNTQRDNLAANLTTKGVTAANTETLAQLVPKVLDITIPSSGNIFVNNACTIPVLSIMPTATDTNIPTTG